MLAFQILLIRRLSHTASILALLFFLVAGLSCKPLHDEKSLYGKWQGQYKSDDLLFNFLSDGTCELRFEKRATGAVFILVGRYRVVFEKFPAALTITNLQRLDHDLHTIIQFRNSHVLKMAPFAPIRQFRPITFQESIYLNRVQ